MARVLAISSQVVRGGVGLSATVPALQSFGHEVWALPTILLSTRPGLGLVEKLVPPPETLRAMLAALESDGGFAGIDAVVTGYFPTAEAVAVAADAIRRIKRANPAALYLCDPVLGDCGRLYIAGTVAAAVRELLLAQADIATPNRFELEWLAGHMIADRSRAIAAARALGPKAVVVTTADETADAIATLFIDIDGISEHASPRQAAVPNGTGDALSGLLLGAWLAPRAMPRAAFCRAMVMLDRLVGQNHGADVLAPAVASRIAAASVASRCTGRCHAGASPAYVVEHPELLGDRAAFPRTTT